MWIVLKRWRPHWDSAPTQSGPLRRHRRFQDRLRLRHNPTPDPQLLPRHGYQPKSTFTNLTIQSTTSTKLAPGLGPNFSSILISNNDNTLLATPTCGTRHPTATDVNSITTLSFVLNQARKSHRLHQGCSKSNLDIFSINAHFFLHTGPLTHLLHRDQSLGS